MVNLLTAKQTIRDWLEVSIRIDEWDADPPRTLTTTYSDVEVPANTAIEFPVKELQITTLGVNTVFGEGTFTYQIMWRYHETVALKDLPVSDIEAVSEYLHALALINLGGCGGIRDVEPMLEEFPVQVSRTGTDQNDWLLVLNLSFRVQFSITEFGISGDYAPLTPTESNEFSSLGIRSYIADVGDDPTTPSNLDEEFTIPRP